MNAKIRYETVRLRLLATSLLAVTIALSGCASAQAQQQPRANPAVSDSARSTAAQQHPQILAQFGGEITGPLSTYVKRVGEKTAIAAALPGKCTFTVLNSDVVNAFAVPGCYIYITRGLLTIMNSEDELASVLGHEVAHVVVNHSGKRQRNATIAQLGALLLGVATKSDQVMQIVGTAAQAYVLNYSRTQEYQSDEIGVRYLKANNYNPFAAADMLSALGQQEALEAKVRDRPASSLPTWQRSHPLSADRVTRATSNARILNGSATPPAEIVGPYMEAIRGLRVGDDPEQGFINGRVFSHPTIKISFEVPAGFTLSNSPEAVQFIGPNSVKGQFAGGSTLSGRLDSYANTTLRAVLGRTPAQFGSPQATTINGFPAVSMLGRATPQGGQAIDVAVMAYNVNGKAYHFIIVGPANQLNTTFSITQSLRGLSSSDIAALRPRQIEIVTVRSGDTIASLSARMAYPDFQTDRFKMINAITTNRALINGERLKIVSYGAALR